MALKPVFFSKQTALNCQSFRHQFQTLSYLNTVIISILTCQFNLKILNIYFKRKLYYYYKWNLVSLILDTIDIFPTTQEKTTYGHHQMANTEIRLIIFFAAKGGEALYSQQKQDRELTVAQTINPLLPNSDLN